MSLRWRWSIAVAGLAAIAASVMVVVSYVSVERELRDRVDADLLRRVSAERGPLFDLMPGRGPFGPGMGGAPPAQLDAVVQVIDGQGSVLFRLEGDPTLPVEDRDLALASGPGPEVLRDVEVGDVPYRMVTSHLELTGGRGSRVDAAIQVAVDVSDLEAALSSLRLRLTVLGAAAVALSGLAGWLIARRAVRPIERLTDVSTRVATTEQLDADLPLDAPGEVGTLARSMSSMLGSLSASRREQQRLVSDAGHELRTPLTALRTNLETLLRRSAEIDEAQRDELLRAALSEAEELSDLSGELVDLASDVRHSDEPAMDIDLDLLAQEVADRYRRRTGKQIDVRSSGDTTVRGRRSQLDRAVANLVDNAVKWSPTEGRVEIRVVGHSVRVRDQGPGIPEGDLPHVFERFHRAATARTMPGSGLGLSIVEQVIGAHGGTVTASNADDGGAVVGFDLP